jgi:hypothetical protein
MFSSLNQFLRYLKYQKYHWVIHKQNWKNLLFLAFFYCSKIIRFAWKSDIPFCSKITFFFLSWNCVIDDCLKKNQFIPMIFLPINRSRVLLNIEVCECYTYRNLTNIFSTGNQSKPFLEHLMANYNCLNINGSVNCFKIQLIEKTIFSQEK